MSQADYRITIQMEPRPDGGLRIWSDDVPELVLSHADAEQVLADVPRALEVILAHRLGHAVQIRELATLSGRPDARGTESRDYAALAA